VRTYLDNTDFFFAVIVSVIFQSIDSITNNEYHFFLRHILVLIKDKSSGDSMLNCFAGRNISQ